MNYFNLKIVSFDKVIFEGVATYCSIVTPDGKIGFKSHHEPFVSVLKNESIIEYHTDSGNRESVNVQNGLFTFDNNECTMTVF